LSTSRAHECEHAPVAACCGHVEGEGIEGCLDPLQTLLTHGALDRIVGGVGSSCEFRECDRGDRRSFGQLIVLDVLEVDDH